MIQIKNLVRLHALSFEELAEALHGLAKQFDEAMLAVDQLTLTNDGAYKLTKRVISSLKRSLNYFDWSDIPLLRASLTILTKILAT